MKSLHDRLREAIPGATTVFAAMTTVTIIDDETGTHRQQTSTKPTEKWRVMHGTRVLALGSTEREAIDRALFLYGSQR